MSEEPSDKRRPRSAAKEDPRELAWDRVGWMMQDMATTASRVWDRNLQVWSKVSNNLRRERPYTADMMADDAAKAMVAVLDNLDDFWTTVTRPPERQQVAAPLPAAVLIFEQGSAVAAPTWIRIAPKELDEDGAPPAARLLVSGDDDGKVGDAVRLTPEKHKGYKLESSGTGVPPSGVHTGLVVYRPGSTPRVLADVRIVVP
jgi:hypothetical protein